MIECVWHAFRYQEDVVTECLCTRMQLEEFWKSDNIGWILQVSIMYCFPFLGI